MKKIGLCGTGKMGKAIGARLIEKEYDLLIWNRTKSNSDDLIKSGGKFFKKVSELVDEVDIIIVILGNDDALKNVYETETGFKNCDLKNKTIIEMSTTSVNYMKELSNLVLNQNGSFIECPVGGSTKPARDGQLLGLMGGKKSEIDSLDFLFSHLFRRYEYLGEIGKGTAMKLAINLPLLVYWQSLGEALKLTCQNGIQFEKALDIMMDTSGACKVAHLKTKTIINAFENNLDGSSTFGLESSLKDMKLMQEDAIKHGNKLKIVSEAIKYVEKGLEKNFHNEDASCTSGLIPKNFN